MKNPVPKVRGRPSICWRAIIASAVSLLLATRGQAQVADATACARADLVMITKLEEVSSANTTSSAIHDAVKRMLDARSACMTGDFFRGLALYREAAVLADHRGSPELEGKSP